MNVDHEMMGRRKDDGSTMQRVPLQWDGLPDAVATAAAYEIVTLREQLRFTEEVACELAGFLARSDVIGARAYIATLRAQGSAGYLIR